MSDGERCRFCFLRWQREDFLCSLNLKRTSTGWCRGERALLVDNVERGGGLLLVDEVQSRLYLVDAMKGGLS